MNRIFTLTLLLTLFSHTIYSQGSGAALEFNGLDNFIEVSSNASLDFGSNDFTLECWIYLDDLGIDGIITTMEAASGGDGYAIMPNGGNLLFALGCGASASPCNSDLDIISSTQFTLNEWQHITAIKRGASMELYRNGELVGTNGISPSNLTMTAGRPVLIGRRYVSNNNFYHDGKIDEVRIWNRALSETEIRENMCQTLNGPQPNLVAYYRMNEGIDNSCSGGEDVCDLTGNGNHGTKF